MTLVLLFILGCLLIGTRSMESRRLNVDFAPVFLSSGSELTIIIAESGDFACDLFLFNSRSICSGFGQVQSV